MIACFAQQGPARKGQEARRDQRYPPAFEAHMAGRMRPRVTQIPSKEFANLRKDLRRSRMDGVNLHDPVDGGINHLHAFAAAALVSSTTPLASPRGPTVMRQGRRSDPSWRISPLRVRPGHHKAGSSHLAFSALARALHRPHQCRIFPVSGSRYRSGTASPLRAR